MAIVISLDHGNKMMKGHSCAFTSGYVECGHLPTMDSDVLLYEGKEYALSDRRVIQKNDKTEDESYLILTLFAIGKELLARNQAATAEKPVDIELLAGLPPLHYKAMHKKFEQYFTSDARQFNFELNRQPMSIKIVKTHVFPQAYAAALTIYEQIKDSPIVNIVDIGGYTADCIQLENVHGLGLRANMDICTSLYLGVNSLFKKINEQVRATGAQNIRDSVIENILCEDNNSLEHYSKARVELIKKEARKFSMEVLAEVAHTGLDLSEDITVFVGGGSMLLKKYLEQGGKTTKSIFVDDLFANVKGYQIIYEAQKSALQKTS